MSSDLFSKRDHGHPPLGADTADAEANAPFIDYGKPLPEGYPGRRVRLMIRDPERLFVYWELDGWRPHKFAVTALTPHGDIVRCVEVPGDCSDAWLELPPGTEGRLLLEALTGDGRHFVAELGFTMPRNRPSDATDEAWGSLDREGHLAPAQGIEGTAAWPLDGVPPWLYTTSGR